MTDSIPRLAALLATFALAGSCAVPPDAALYEAAELPAATPAGYGIVETPARGPLGGSPAYGTPFWIPGQDVDLVPFVRTEEKWWVSDDDHFNEGGRAPLGTRFGSSKAMFLKVRWHNAVFRSRTTGEQHALLDRRGVVSRVWAVLDGTKDDAGATALLFVVTDQDTNGDGVLDDKDGSRVVLTGPAGQDPTIVSPEATQVDDVRVDADGQRVVLLLREDTDGDGKFEGSELPVAYSLHLSSGGPARRLVDRSLEASMDALLN